MAGTNLSRMKKSGRDDVEIHIARSELIEVGRQIVLAAQVTCCCEAGVVYGWTALDYAMDRGRKGMVNSLKARGGRTSGRRDAS